MKSTLTEAALVQRVKLGSMVPYACLDCPEPVAVFTDGSPCSCSLLGKLGKKRGLLYSTLNSDLRPRPNFRLLYCTPYPRVQTVHKGTECTKVHVYRSRMGTDCTVQEYKVLPSRKLPCTSRVTCPGHPSCSVFLHIVAQHCIVDLRKKKTRAAHSPCLKRS